MRCCFRITLPAFLFLFVTAARAADLSTPKLSAHANQPKSVSLALSLSRTKITRSTKVTIQGAPRGGKFQTIASITQPISKMNVVLSNLPEGSMSFRARVSNRSRKSKWSSSKRVMIAGEAAIPNPTPPPASTPTPTPGPTPSPGSPTTDCGAEIVPAMIQLLNIARVGLPPISFQSQLQTAAKNRAAWMASTGEFTHLGWYEAIQASGFTGPRAAENIAYGYTTVDSVMNAWLQSTGHRDNILNPGLTVIGIGCARDSAGRPYWTQEFGGY